MSGREDNIEDRIISDVEANTGDDFSPEPSTGDEGGTGSNSSAEPASSSAPEQRRPEQSQAPNREARNKQGNKQTPDTPKPKRDEKGNIVDGQGNVIAQRGVERRLHTQNERLKESNKSLIEQVATLRQQVESTQSLGGLPKQYGLNDRDVGEAFKIAGMMKRNPVEGAKAALTFALSQGADLSQIVQAENLQNINLAAQRRMQEELYERQFGPIQNQQKVQQQLKAASDQANHFAAAHPDAEEHFDDVAKMVPEIIKRAASQGRQIDVYTAAEMGLQMLQNWAMQNGLHPNRHIQTQLEEIRARNGQRPNNQRQDVRTSQPRRQAPMPNGSRGVDNVPSRSGSLPANASMDAIVRQAMQDNGMRF